MTLLEIENEISPTLKLDDLYSLSNFIAQRIEDIEDLEFAEKLKKAEKIEDIKRYSLRNAITKKDTEKIYITQSSIKIGENIILQNTLYEIVAKL